MAVIRHDCYWLLVAALRDAQAWLGYALQPSRKWTVATGHNGPHCATPENAAPAAAEISLPISETLHSSRLDRSDG